jgi:hypothetical protein
MMNFLDEVCMKNYEARSGQIIKDFSEIEIWSIKHQKYGYG